MNRQQQLQSAMVISLFFACSFCVCKASASGLPFWEVQNRSLHAFFGNAKGNYYDPDALLSRQVSGGLGIGLATSGKTITELPYLGSGLYLDFGGVWQDQFDDKAAVIIEKDGKVYAAALLSVNCVWTNQKQQQEDCGNETQTLKVFKKNQGDTRWAVPVFKQWATAMRGNPSPTIVVLARNGSTKSKTKH